MSNFYCTGDGCKVVLNSRSDYCTIDGLPYCVDCYIKTLPKKKIKIAQKKENKKREVKNDGI